MKEFMTHGQCPQTRASRWPLSMAAGLALVFSLTSCVEAQPRPDGSLVVVSQHRMAGTSIPEELRVNAGMIDLVTPMWFDVTDAGEVVRLEEVSGSFDAYREFCRKHDLQLVPIVRNFTPQPLLADPKATARTADAVHALARAEGFDGILIDFEHLKPESREPLVDLMRRLSPQMRRDGLTLGIAVGPRSWQGEFDYAGLARYSDFLYVMFYDYTGPWNPSRIGATAPIHRPERVNDIMRDLREILDTGVPPEKVLVGVPLYGNVFRLDEDGNGVEARTLYLSSILELKKRHQATSSWDDTAKAPFFEFRDEEGRLHQAWYEDARSFEYKLRLAAEFDLGGWAVWAVGARSGDGGPEFWPSLGRARQSRLQ